MALALTGTRPLLHATVRHEGRLFAPWVLLVTALSASSVLVYPWVFSTQQERFGLSVAIGSNPALGLIFGPAHNLLTVDGFNAWRSLALGGFLVGLGAIFAVTRATRGQEDSGQAELFASGVLGRGSRLMTAVGVGLIGSLMAGIVSASVTLMCGGGLADTLLLCATFTATGWLFTGVAAVASQLGSDARAANSMAVGSLCVLFLLRGFAYSVDAPAWTIWINPLGWMSETEPAHANAWWPLLLAVALAVVLLVLAFTLQARRDFGQGAIAPRPGPARGSVRTTWRLAFALNRGSLVVWALAAVMLGLVFGRMATSVKDILASNPAVQQVLASEATSSESLIPAFLVTILSMIGIVLAIPGVLVMLRVRSEELNDRLEPVLAGAVARPRYYASNVLLALLAPSVFVLVAGTIVAVQVSGAGIGTTFGQSLTQAIAVVPAVWTIVAVSVAVVGARPQVVLAAWVGVVASFALTLLGPTFGLDDWVLGISPFWHAPITTLPDPDCSGLLWISLFTVGFLVVGFSGFRRRDVAR
jgi:ABC-2 type transport system permease protein